MGLKVELLLSSLKYLLCLRKYTEKSQSKPAWDYSNKYLIFTYEPNAFKSLFHALTVCPEVRLLHGRSSGEARGHWSLAIRLPFVVLIWGQLWTRNPQPQLAHSAYPRLLFSLEEWKQSACCSPPHSSLGDLALGPHHRTLLQLLSLCSRGKSLTATAGPSCWDLFLCCWPFLQVC